MNDAEREALAAGGVRVGDAEDFLGLTDEERRLIELRVAVSRAVRRLREFQGLTQQQVAASMKSTQARVARIEAGAAGVSLDLMFRGLFAVGGRVTDLTGPEFGSRMEKSSGLPPSNRARASDVSPTNSSKTQADASPRRPR